MGRKSTRRLNRSILENVQILTGEASPRVFPSDYLRTLVVLKYALTISGLSLAEFSRQYIEPVASNEDEKDATNLVYQWLRRESVASRKKLERVFEAFPPVRELFDHPFFELLKNRAMSVADVNQLLRPFESKLPFVDWQFKIEDLPMKEMRWPSIVGRNNTQRLRDRGDLDGLAVILGLVREAEATHNTHDHFLAMADLYRGLMFILGLPWFRKYQRLLCSCVESIHSRDLISAGLVHPNWMAIHRFSKSDYQKHLVGSISIERFMRHMLLEHDFVMINLPEPPKPLRDPVSSRKVEKTAKQWFGD